MPQNWTERLLRWYRINRRDLPWRRTADPYAVWISEIMLQQTTVETVIPYYERFLSEFPTVKNLAKAGEEEVLKLWSGLGYYSRARNLHKAAQRIVADLGCGLPNTVEALMELPGIGRYSAGAIASIAFGKRAPIVDGNVIRVLSRLFAIAQDPKSAAGQKIFWKKAEDVLPKKNCGDFNQALMELGAMVCAPENPSCVLCPVANDCRARKESRPENFPKPKKKTEYRDVLMSAAVIQRDGKILFVRRPDRGLLRGMWELPMAEGGIEALQKSWALEVERRLPVVSHSVLNRRLKISPFLCRLEKGAAKENPDRRWIARNEVHDIPTSSMNRKIINRIDL
jgi:A/G-specific adenine glycosylase